MHWNVQIMHNECRLFLSLKANNGCKSKYKSKHRTHTKKNKSRSLQMRSHFPTSSWCVCVCNSTENASDATKVDQRRQTKQIGNIRQSIEHTKELPINTY